MVKIKINGKEITAKRGDTILQAASKASIEIPTLCYLKELSPSGACRLCVVEAEGIPHLIPSCSFPVEEGLNIHTHSPKVFSARKVIIELLLSNHPNDCLYCNRSNSCKLSKLAREYGIEERIYPYNEKKMPLDISSPSITRDPNKCILCGKCVRVCEEIQSVSALEFINRGSRAFVGCAFNNWLNISSCVNCGQCIMVCPTGALSEKKQLKEVIEALSDPKKHVVVQHAPSISISLAESFGVKSGLDLCDKMVAAFRRMGFNKVFDTSFAADLTVMEGASELIKRVKTNTNLPMITSCSPSWVKFAEQFYPEHLNLLSTCKSPQQMLGAIIKTYYAEKNSIDPKDIFTVSVMPCTAKKFEASKPNMGQGNRRDIDATLTTRELIELIKLFGINLIEMQPEAGDSPFSSRSTAGKLFAGSGGIMEATMRTAHYFNTGKELQKFKLESARGLKGIKKATISIGDTELKVAIISGLQNARIFLEEIKASKEEYHFVEVMACTGGCINGGGQPLEIEKDTIKSRLHSLYHLDRTKSIKQAHVNKGINALYKDFLGEPLGEISQKLLHTQYYKRDILR